MIFVHIEEELMLFESRQDGNGHDWCRVLTYLVRAEIHGTIMTSMKLTESESVSSRISSSTT